MIDKKTVWDTINSEKSKDNDVLRKNVEKFLLQYKENQISRDELIKKLRMSEFTKILTEQQIDGLVKIADTMIYGTNISKSVWEILEQTKAFWLGHINEDVVKWWLLQALDILQEWEEKQAYEVLLNEYLESSNKNNINIDAVLKQTQEILENARLRWELKSDRALLDIWTWENGTYWLLFQSLWYEDITLQDISSANINTLKTAQNEGKIPQNVKLKMEDIINADESIQYDTIIASFVAHHIESKEDKQQFFDKIYKLLKPGWKAIVSFFMPNRDYLNGDKETFPSFYDNHPVSNISHENFIKFIKPTFWANYKFLWNGVTKWKPLFYWTYELTKRN